MKKPRLKIEVNLKDGVYHYQIYQKGQSIADMGNYTTDAEACEAAELKKVELQEAMMKVDAEKENNCHPHDVVRKPRKVKVKITKLKSCVKYSDVCGHLTEAVNSIQSITIGEAGENFERLQKAVETIQNVNKDLSEIN